MRVSTARSEPSGHQRRIDVRNVPVSDHASKLEYHAVHEAQLCQTYNASSKTIFRPGQWADLRDPCHQPTLNDVSLLPGEGFTKSTVSKIR
jgi:hypothetical protein